MTTSDIETCDVVVDVSVCSLMALLGVPDELEVSVIQMFIVTYYWQVQYAILQ